MYSRLPQKKEQKLTAIREFQFRPDGTTGKRGAIIYSSLELQPPKETQKRFQLKEMAHPWTFEPLD